MFLQLKLINFLDMIEHIFSWPKLAIVQASTNCKSSKLYKHQALSWHTCKPITVCTPLCVYAWGGVKEKELLRLYVHLHNDKLAKTLSQRIERENRTKYLTSFSSPTVRRQDCTLQLIAQTRLKHSCQCGQQGIFSMFLKFNWIKNSESF